MDYVRFTKKSVAKMEATDDDDIFEYDFPQSTKYSRM